MDRLGANDQKEETKANNENISVYPTPIHLEISPRRWSVVFLLSEAMEGVSVGRNPFGLA